MFSRLMDILVETSVDYLSQQVVAGADALQIFDSWAGSLADDQFERWVVAPTRAMVSKLQTLHPEVPIIGFPRGADQLSASFARSTGVHGVSCNTAMPIQAMAALADEADTVVQGNLDPLLLVTGGRALDARIDEIKSAMRGRRHIFNLGHGIIPQTPPENVGRLVERVRGGAH